jgi:multisubunit Na+/H+ antiporter MnhB subunit
MENQDTNQPLFNLGLSESAKTSLRGAARVAGAAAILGLVTSIIRIVLSFTSRNKFESRYEGFSQHRVAAERSPSIVSAIIVLAISILLFSFLNRFASLTKTGLNGNNAQVMNEGLGALANYFVTVGVLVILCLVLFAVVLAGLAAGM